MRTLAHEIVIYANNVIVIDGEPLPWEHDSQTVSINPRGAIQFLDVTLMAEKITATDQRWVDKL